MLVTRATRRDDAELKEFYDALEWGETTLGKGVGFIARQGPIVGSVRLIEVDPHTLVVEDVLVAPDHRRRGVGTQLMQAAMNSRGGTLYLCCHDNAQAFYERLGFSLLPFEELPDDVRSYFEAAGDAPHQLSGDHVHLFMSAR